MTIKEVYQIAFEKVFEDAGYEKSSRLISEIFDLIDEKASSDEDWEEYAIFVLEVTKKILEWIRTKKIDKDGK